MMQPKLSPRKLSQIILWTFLFLLLIFMTIPIFWAILGSFKTTFEIVNHPFSLPSSWSFDNLIEAWQVGNFQTYFLNSAFITTLGMIIVFLVACPAGYAFAHMRFHGNNLLFYLILLGLALPVQAIIIPVFFQLRQMGLINTLWGVILVSVALALPFSIFLMRNTFRDIPKELKESAFMDGASEWRTYMQVMLPLAKPGVVALMVFTFMNIWNDLLLPLVLLVTNDKFTIPLGLMSFQGETGTEYGLIFGGTIISMIPSIIVYLIFQRHFIEGMAAGSNK